MKCAWPTNQRGQTCIYGCGYALKRDYDERPVRVCPGGPQQQPRGLISKASNYSKSVLKWIAAGRPSRSESECVRILEICKACEYYDSEKLICKMCGCGLGGKTPLTNKIMMPTESCPLNPPKWEAEV
jgi:hypothetical protein